MESIKDKEKKEPAAAAEKKPKKKEPVKKTESTAKASKEVALLTAELEAAKAQADEQKEQHMRTLAEYDNFRKRTAREKEELSAFIVADTVSKLLPALDALDAAENLENADAKALLEGIVLVKKQLADGLAGCGVEVIKTDEGFDPNLHNALMHVEDESLGESAIAEVFQKGYQVKGKVIRHTLVKVAN